MLGDMGMIPDLGGVIGVELLVAYVALGLLVEAGGEPTLTLQELSVVIETNRLGLESPQISNKLLFAILSHPRLVSNVELGEEETI